MSDATLSPTPSGWKSPEWWARWRQKVIALTALLGIF